MLALVLVVALMPSSCGYTWSDELDSIIRQESDAAGVPLDLAYAFIAAESGFDPTTHVDNALEDSVGLLELNRRGGQGSGHSVAELMDPRRNLQIGLPPIRRAFEQSWAPDIDPFEFIYLVATRSGHPGPVPRNDARIIRIANLWACFYGGVGFSLQGPGTAGVVVGAPGPTMASAIGQVFLLFAAAVPLVIYEGYQVASGLAVAPSLKPPLPSRSLFSPKGVLPSISHHQRRRTGRQG